MRTTTPSFILKLPIKTTSSDEAILEKMFDAGRQMYNACLGESDRRYYLMKQSKEYQRVLKMPKGNPTSVEQVARTAAFRNVSNRFQFNEYDISKYATLIRASWVGCHLNSHIAQKISKRAFKAVQKKAFGIARRVRFKSKNQFGSLECKNNETGLIFRDNILYCSSLKLAAIIDPKNEYQNYGLNHRIKYCRLLKKDIKGKFRYSVQLILEGTPYQDPKHPVGYEEVGLDIGPSTIAYVGDNKADLKQFCSEIIPDWKKTRRVQRGMNRSQRVTNHENYTDIGTIKKGVKLIWRKSKRYKKLQSKYNETNRKISEYRKSLHGKLANEIIAVGCKIKTEKLSYRAWQKQFGRSVTVRAPSMIVSLIQRKAENAHGYLHEIPTHTTKLSQTCHMCGAQVKKPLTERWHKCCGMEIQRDLYSAFLAKCVNINTDTLDRSKAKLLWGSLEPVLQSALLRVYQESKLSTIGGNPVPASFGLGQSQSGSHEKPEKVITEIADDVNCSTVENCEKVIATAGILHQLV